MYPGTVGGGIRMNAGCFGNELKDILFLFRQLIKRGNIITIPSKDIKFKYRGKAIYLMILFF